MLSVPQCVPNPWCGWSQLSERGVAALLPQILGLTCPPVEFEVNLHAHSILGGVKRRF